MQRAFRQDLRLVYEADQGMSDVSRDRRGLADHRNAGEDRGRHLLQKAPAREVEGVDVNRDASQRGDDVLSYEASAPRQPLDVALQEEGGIRQLPSAF